MAGTVTIMVIFSQDVVTKLVADHSIQFGYRDFMPNRIKALRQDRGLTQEQLAEMAGTTKQQIGRLEMGRRRLSDLWEVRLAKALQCHRIELYEDATVIQSPREQAILQMYRGLSEQGQAAFEKVAHALSEPAGPPDANGKPTKSAA